MVEPPGGPALPGTPAVTGRRRRFVTPKIVLAVVLAVVATVFVFQNTERGRVHFLLWSARMPGWIWLLGVFVAGIVVGSLFPWLRRRRRRVR